MEEADKILIDSLLSLGLEVFKDEISLEDFNADILICAVSLCLENIFENKNDNQSFPKRCPESMAARFKVGQTLSEVVRSLGYKDTVGYQSFLYPNVRDTRKIISFLVEQLPKDPGGTLEERGSDFTQLHNKIKQVFSENLCSPWLPYYCKNKNYSNTITIPKCLLINSEKDRKKLPNLCSWFDKFPSIQAQSNNTDELLCSILEYENRCRILEGIDESRILRQLTEIDKLQRVDESSKIRLPPKIKKRTKLVKKEIENEPPIKDEVIAEEGLNILEDKLKEVQANYEEYCKKYDDVLKRLELNNEKYESLQMKSKQLKEDIEIQTKESVIKEKTGILLMHGVESVDKLQGAVHKREQQLKNIDTQWEVHKKELLEKVELVQTEQLNKYSKTRELENTLESVKTAMENCRKDYQVKDVQIKILDERVKQILKQSPTQAKQSRNEFTKRILELTENKKKQNSEIRKILSDIFVLQKEINSLRGKLERSFLETNDCIITNAKRDEMSKKMYKVVVTIHENCQSLVDVIEEKGKLLREIRDLEMSVESENRENVERNLEKITEDYNEAKKNCESLRKKLQQ